MGAFTVTPALPRGAREPVPLDQLDFEPARVLTAGQWQVRVHPSRYEQDAAVLCLDDGFVALAGNILFRGRRNAAALGAIHGLYAGATEFLDEAIGHFALAIYKNGRLTVVTDRMSAFKLFIVPERHWLSTSFLALAKAVRPNLDRQAVYEFVLTGAVLGDATLLQEVRTLPHGRNAIFLPEMMEIDRSVAAMPCRSDLDSDDLLAATDERLNQTFDAIASAWGDGLCCALTGGYDSRLILAHLLRRGLTPRLLVYGAEDSDTRLARHIAAGEGLTLDVINPGHWTIPIDSFADVVWRNFLHGDGYHHQGLFTNDVEIAERRRRTEGGGVFLHGGGGEIFRNFFLLPGRPFATQQIVAAMYAKYDPSVCAPGFDGRAFEAQISAKIGDLVGGPGALDRQIVEWIYPNFRCRAWFGRESSLNNAVGASLMPFYERTITDFAATIPVEDKVAGAFEAQLIARAKPRLARYPSQYGHHFAGPPSLEHRLLDTLKCHIPPNARGFLYALRERRRPNLVSPYFSKEYVESVLGPEPHPVLRLFDLNAMRDPSMTSRALSVAYLATHVGA